MEKVRAKSQDQTGDAEAAVAVSVAPGPLAPVPLPVAEPKPQPTLQVGHAEDPAEHDADRRADNALARLAGLEPEDESVPVAAHVHRSAAPAGYAAGGQAVVGREGGVLDASASDAISSRIGTGRPLDGAVLKRMESAFDTSLSQVRIHTDSSAASLNRMVSARAFTTGNDIFFGGGEYAPETPAGERVLAHELAHTLQRSYVAHRLEEGPLGAGSGAPQAGASLVPGPVVHPVAGEQEHHPADGVPAPVGADAPVPPPAPTTKIGMAELLALTDDQIRDLVKDTSPTGPLMDLLKNAFEADWFKAKGCLVFGRWPAGKPAFTDESSLSLMSALTVLRGEIHKLVMPKAQAAVAAELATQAERLKGNPKLAEALRAETGLKPEEQVAYKGSVGADTVTSDVDVSTGGKNSELAVKVYNEQFRDVVGLEVDPGTVFDLNVYAKDFIHGLTTSKQDNVTTVVPTGENADVDPGAENVAARDEEQDVWALVHVARYLPEEADWNSYVAKSLEGIVDSSRNERQKRLFAKARSRAKGFEDSLQSMMDELRDTVDTSLATLGKSAWNEHDNEQFTENAVRMRAANRLYEEKLLQVKELRVQIQAIKDEETAVGALIAKTDEPEDAKQLARVKQAELLTRKKKLVSEVAGAVSAAQLYANEVYGSGGATVHAVFGVQTKRKMQKELRETDPAARVDVVMSPAQWQQAFTDNLGDVMKDYEHFASAHGAQEPDYWYAAFKMGKYVDRMVDAVPNLAAGGLISETDAGIVQSSPEFLALAELAREHVLAKDGPAKNKPQLLKSHDYFGTMDKGRVDAFKNQALALGAMVRAMAANLSAEPVGGSAEAAGPSPATKADPAKLGKERINALGKLLEVANRTGKTLETTGSK